MDYTPLFSFLSQAFETERAMENLTAIWSSDRWFDFSAFAETARFCHGRLEAAGLSDLELLPLRADGNTRYGDWAMPRAWDAESAGLRLPDGTVLADYGQVPTSLVMYSAPTPPAGLTAEVVLVEGGVPPRGVSLAGKLLFTEGPAGGLAALAAERGAAGIITDFFPLYPGTRDSKEEMAGHSRWENDFLLPRNDTGLFAFSLSPENGALLRERLKAGPVSVHAEVNASFRDGEAMVASAAIPGTGAGEVLVYGHLYEPGALDNASGCASILELARCINAGILAGRIPRPARTLRFVLGWECVGSTAWMQAHPETVSQAFCGIVADMVGTEEIDRTRLSVWHNPLSNYSFADALISEIIPAQQAWLGAAYPWEERPFSVGTDNILGDPCWGMPTVAMITEPALSYHSSLDRPERIDPAILHRCAVALGTYLLAAASLEEAERLRLDALARAERDRRMPVSFPPPEGEGLDLIPSRLVPGCLTLAGREDLKNAPWQPAWSDRLHLPLFWADGKRSLGEIAALSAAEAGESGDQVAARAEWLREYFRFLEEAGYCKLRTKDGMS